MGCFTRKSCASTQAATSDWSGVQVGSNQRACPQAQFYDRASRGARGDDQGQTNSVSIWNLLASTIRRCRGRSSVFLGIAASIGVSRPSRSASSRRGRVLILAHAEPRQRRRRASLHHRRAAACTPHRRRGAAHRVAQREVVGARDRRARVPLDAASRPSASRRQARGRAGCGHQLPGPRARRTAGYRPRATGGAPRPARDRRAVGSSRA